MLLAYYGDVRRTDLQPLSLSQYRLERLSHIKRPLKRQQGIGAELLLYAALKKASPLTALPADIAVDEYGKPYLPDSELCFSLSHSGSFAFCALADRELGADVQRISSYDSGLVSRFFADGEREYIAASEDKNLAFTLVWASKESYIKALGQGLSISLASFDVCQNGALCQRLGSHSFWHTVAEGYAFSVCVQGADPKPDVFEKINI